MRASAICGRDFARGRNLTIVFSAMRRVNSNLIPTQLVAPPVVRSATAFCGRMTASQKNGVTSGPSAVSRVEMM
jgi:hypothetical protein